MAKSNIIKVEALAGCTAGLEVTQDFTKAVKYMVTYETGSVRYYDAEKAPKTVMAWIEAHTEVVEPEIEVVEQEVVRVEQVVEQVVKQAVPQRTRSYQTIPTLSDIDIEWMSWMWDITNLLMMLFRFGLIGAAWLLEGTARALPVIRAVIVETAGVIQEIAGWIFEGVDLVKEAVVYVGALL